MNCKPQHKMTLTNMPYMSFKIEGRKKCRQNRMICAVNLWQDFTCQEYTEVKQPYLLYGEPVLCNNYVLKDLDYIDHFCINFPCHCVLDQIHLDTNLLNNVILTKDVL